MGFYKLSILTTAFSHLMKIMKETSSMFEIRGARYWNIEEKKKKADNDVPYLYRTLKTSKSIQLRKESMQHFDYKKTLKWLAEEDVGDLSVDSFSMIVSDGIVKKAFEKAYNTKLADDRFVLCFKCNTDAGKEDRTRQSIANIMRLQIDNFGFKVASLDLIGIYQYQDYKGDKKLNMLTEMAKGDEALRDIADQYFKEFIIIHGAQKKIRATKYYEMGNKNMPILKDMKVF